MIYFVGQNNFFDGNKNIIQNASVEDCLNYFKNHYSIQVDTETQGRDPHTKKIISLQIGDTNNQYVIDCRHIDILLFKNLLESKLCILHNAKFDYSFLKIAGIILERIYDTMLAECIIYCGYEKWGYGLDKLVKRYCNVTLSKDTRGEFYLVKDKPLTFKQIEYGSLDVKYLHDIKKQQEAKLSKYKLQYCANLEFEVVKALADIELNGMYLNTEKWLKLAEKYEDDLIKYEDALDELLLTDPILKNYYKSNGVINLFGEQERQLNINYSSPSQVQKLINYTGIELENTSNQALIANVNKHPLFGKLIDYRTSAKRVSTYGKSFLKYINNNTGRVHTNFWQILATGRISSGSEQMNAPNLQNIPNDNTTRNCFEAREGYSWVSIDYSGQELRLMADASNESGFIDCLNSGDDLHCFVGSMMFKRKITKADKDLRQKAKTINFGKPYGMGPLKLASTLKISMDEAESLFLEYAKAFPRLNKWLDKQGNKAKRNMYSSTYAPCLRRRWYPDMRRAKYLRALNPTDTESWREIYKIEGSTERNGMNAPIQGTGADITKEALVGVRKLVSRYNKEYGTCAYLICTVHDQIDVEVREDFAERFAKEMETIMIDCGNKYVSQVNMDVDTTITKMWVK
jgi:DNA polymerase I-like protein with 3'-5' exonuclease and polymerase domains